ncbi:MAG: 2OG-Fe(II) oxygenase [Bacteroidales bacterium]|nr:2OG-Fe(II) oxygenase [Bacteroidales bacterium]MBN2812972.1 2OG-Fe(II) oxygenase [Bacteroidales bacterium]
MKTVSIYLRSVRTEKGGQLSLFDSNRNSGIDDLETLVAPGSMVIWKPDCLSSIKAITAIRAKSENNALFGNKPVKRRFCKGFYLLIPKDIKEGREAYAIDYVTCDGEKKSIDPYIKIKPPQP